MKATRKLLLTTLLVAVFALSIAMLTACHEHVYTKQTTTEPTCTSAGMATFTCACGEFYTEEIPMLGHDLQIHQAQAETCTSIGWTEYQTCKRDGCDYSTYQEIAATGNHSWDDGVITTMPTCNSEGVKTLTCTVCQATSTQSVEKLQHLLHTHPAQAPTCTENGWYEYQSCQRTGCTYTTYQQIDAPGHSWDDGVVTTQPTCTTTGEKIFTCTTCQTATRTEPVAELGHDLKTTAAKAPTCTEYGWEEYQTCQRSGCNYSTYQQIDALGHKPGDIVVENNVAPTCTVDGHYDNVTYCTVCKAETSRNTVVVPATGHDYNTEITAPTCTEQGFTTYTCACGHSYVDNYIDTLGHNYVGEVTTAPSCTVNGEKTYTCTNDATHTYTEVVPATGHSYNTEVTAPTCEAQGFTTYTCACGHSYVDNYVDATGHSYNKVVTAPTCENKGYTTYTCHCGHTYVSNYIDALGHNYVGEVTTAPTCTQKGAKTYTCSNDSSHAYTEDIAELGHDLKTTAAKAPTCTEYGWEEYQTCQRTGCNHTTYQELPAGHNLTQHAAQIATCKQIGWDAYETCSRCSYSTYVENPMQHNAEGTGFCLGCNLPESSSGLEYSQNADGTYTVTGLGSCTDTDIVIGFYNGKTVTSIGYYAFSGCTSLTSVTIGNSVTSIGYYAFSGCTSLTSVTIGNSVTSIGYSAFEYCTNLTSVSIGNGVTAIGSYAFDDCTGLTSVHITDLAAWCKISFGSSDANPLYYAENLYLNGNLVTDLVIPDSVTSIGGYAFYKCTSLTGITIPDSVTSIGYAAFSGCSSLQEITLPFVGANKDGTSNTHFGYIFGTSSSYDNYTYVPSSLKKVTITSATSIGYAAFSGCSSLQEITLPFVGAKAGVTSNDKYQYPFGYIFGTSSYDGSTATKQYYYGSSTSSTTYTTYYIPTSLKSVTITGGNILYGAFYNCTGLTSITIPDSVTSIGGSAFSGCTRLTSITIPDSVTSIGGSAFYNCSSLTSVHITDIAAWCNILFGSSTANPLDYAKNLYLNGNLVTDLVIPDSVTSIGSSAFYGCSSLTSITIPNGVTSIGSIAFSGCTRLTSITIPGSVTSIGESAFYNCSSLTSVHITDIAAWYNILFGSSTANPLYYAKNLYLNGNLVTDIVLPDSVTKISSYAFYYCKSLTSITIPDSVTSIGQDAFYNCSSLTSVHITDITAWCNISFGSSNANPLSYAKNLYLNGNLVPDIVLPDSVTKISSYAFYYCKSLTSITIPDSVTSIGESAFWACTSLKSVTIGNGVTSIGSRAFENCTSLISITIPDSVTSIGEYAFCTSSRQASVHITDLAAWCNISFGNGLANPLYHAKNLYLNGNLVTDIVLPDSVTKISSYAFYNYSSLTSITISDSVTSIGRSAFSGCISLQQITLPFVGAKAGVTSSDTYQYPFGYIFGTSSYTGSTATKQYYYGSSTSSTTSSTYYIPTSLKSVTITGGNILYGAFYNCSGLTSVTIGNGVTSIGSSAFSGCSSLQEITLPFAGETLNGTSNTHFGYIFGATSYSDNRDYVPSSLIKVTITSSINDYAFYGCTGLTSITIHDSVTSIGEYVFSGCSGLTSVTIGNGVTSIGGNAFKDCTSLTSVHITDIAAWCNISFRSESANPLDYAKNLYLNGNLVTDIVLPDSVTSIGEYAFYNYSSLTSITIPDSVTSIGSSAFSGCSSLQQITLPFAGETLNGTSNTHFGYIFGATSYDYNSDYIPSSLKKVTITSSINDYAFYGCTGLTSVTIGNGVTSIGGNAFKDCTSLKSITIPDSVTSIGSSAFSGCSNLQEIALPFAGETLNGTSNTHFGYIFGATSYDCNSDYIPSSLIKVTITNASLIDKYAFYHCYSLSMITIGDSVTSIGKEAFYNCNNLYQLSLGNSIVSIGNGAFANCSFLKDVSMPDSVVSIGDNAFYYCTNLSNVFLNSVVSIGKGAFFNCEKLTSITIPSSVTSIGGSAFDGCTRLTSVHITDLTAWCNISFENNSANPLCYAENLYLNGNIVTDLVIPDSITKIREYAFRSCRSLTTITIPDSITSIGKYAFEDCKSLTSVTIGNSVTSIGDYAFWYCSNLTSITIPNSVTSIGDSAFQYCTGLTSITIPDSVTSIGYGAFGGCSSLNDITLPFVGATLTGTSNTHFGYIFGASDIAHNRSSIPSSLISVTITGGTFIDDQAFYRCDKLLFVSLLAESITSIGDKAFYDCTSLLTLGIGGGVTSIGEYALYNCSNLEILTYYGSSWSKISFGYRWNYMAGNYKITTV